MRTGTTAGIGRTGAEKIRFRKNRTGSRTYTKVSFPIRYGTFTELESRDFHLIFNLNHEIRHARSKSGEWTDPSEWMKRTIANDWIYYSTGGYTGVSESIGEYYLPNLPYASNALIGGKPFERPEVKRIVTSWHTVTLNMIEADPDIGRQHPEFVQGVIRNTPRVLEEKARRLFAVSGRRMTVLPPDARHVDYDIIPLNISDGCLYKCRFCTVKNPIPFSVRPMDQINAQISQLKSLYGPDLINYSALMLGEHDALNAPDDLILTAARTAFEEFEFDRSVMQGKHLFMFGSTGAFLKKDRSFFERLAGLGCMTYINIGLESADQKTLDAIGKTVSARDVSTAFDRIQDINAALPHVEITGNFLFSDRLSDNHIRSFLSLVRDRIRRPRTKGCIYLSPMEFDAPSREKMFTFNRLKTLSRLPTYLYIIQRL